MNEISYIYSLANPITINLETGIFYGTTGVQKNKTSYIILK